MRFDPEETARRIAAQRDQRAHRDRVETQNAANDITAEIYGHPAPLDVAEQAVATANRTPDGTPDGIVDAAIGTPTPYETIKPRRPVNTPTEGNTNA